MPACPSLSSTRRLPSRYFSLEEGHEHYVGKVRVVRREAPDTLWQSYAFEFTERTAEWILQD